ncbi:hypothetical protein [Tabrizicola sp.]|uniref:hypothetical protein n=1 Tax=Tabrizicola sp. TaxID=2005166 RepID=UPI00273261D1|nr:hypothetical protein [Tabrizicola sp.]MDP3197271.1 hypothetical protein [Tabrizicola sp.]
MSSLSQGETAEPKVKATTAWIMAALVGAAAAWVGWMLGWPWIVDINHPDFNPIILVEGLLLAVLAVNIVQALRWTRRARDFGASLIDIDGRTPVPLGTPFSGKVRTAQTIRASGEFRLVLTCLDVHERRNMASSSSSSPHSTEAYTVWTAEQTLPATTDSARGLPFRFDLPASVGAKPVPAIRAQRNPYFSGSISINIPGLRRIFTHNKPPVARYWTLVVTATTDGPDYLAEFTVPLADH